MLFKAMEYIYFASLVCLFIAIFFPWTSEDLNGAIEVSRGFDTVLGKLFILTVGLGMSFYILIQDDFRRIIAGLVISIANLLLTASDFVTGVFKSMPQFFAAGYSELTALTLFKYLVLISFIAVISLMVIEVRSLRQTKDNELI